MSVEDNSKIVEPLVQPSKNHVGGSIVQPKPVKRSGRKFGLIILVLIICGGGFLMSGSGRQALFDIQVSITEISEAVAGMRNRQ